MVHCNKLFKVQNLIPIWSLDEPYCMIGSLNQKDYCIIISKNEFPVILSKFGIGRILRDYKFLKGI